MSASASISPIWCRRRSCSSRSPLSWCSSVWGALMAGSLLGSLPVAIFYSLFVDYYVSSLTGAVKE